MPVSKSQLLRRVLSRGDLPTLPEIMQRVMDAVESEHASAQDLSHIIESDPAITSRVLRLANSAFYGQSQGVDSVRRAIVVLGFDTVRHLALTTAVLKTCGKTRQEVLDPYDFWLHSYGAAKAAHLLALQSGRKNIAPLCFTGGLLHDLGKFALALALGQEYQQQVSFAMRHGLRLSDVERHKFGANHAEVGAALLERWGLSPTLQAVLLHQYAPEGYAGPARQEVALVSLSSEISRATGFGQAGDVGPLRLPQLPLLDLQLSGVAIEEVMKALPAYLPEARELLQELQGA